MPAGVASGDIAQNYLLEPLSQAAATQLYRKDTTKTNPQCSFRYALFATAPHDGSLAHRII